MKKKILAVTLAASVTLLTACGGGDKVLVKTDAGDITEQELYTEMKGLAGKQMAEQLILQKIIEANYDVTDKEVEEAFDNQKEMFGDSFDMILAQQGMNEETFKKNLRLQLLQDKMFEDIKVDKKEVDAEVERAKYEVHAQHILVDTEEEAKKVEKLLEEGKPFAEVAKEHSTEPAAQESGGDLDWFGPGKMVPEFDDAVFTMKKGERQIVETDFGFHVVELLDKRESEEGKDEETLREEIEQKMKETILDEKIVKAIKEANIDVKDDDFKGIFEAVLGEPKEDKKDDEKEEKKDDK